MPRAGYSSSEKRNPTIRLAFFILCARVFIDKFLREGMI